MRKRLREKKRPAANGASATASRQASARADAASNDGKDPHAKALGKKGGIARAQSLSPQRRRAIAKKAAAKRWSSP